MTDFILLSHPRSGTNNLCFILCDHPQIHCTGEIFNPNDNGPRYVEKLGVESFVEDPDVDRLPVFFAAAREREKVAAVGFKLFQYQLPGESFLRVLRDVRYRKLILYRECVAQAYLSHFLARQTRQWRLMNEADRRLPEPCSVDLGEARSWMRTRVEQTELWRRLLDELGQPYCLCTYESVFTLDSLRAIDRFLGVPERSAFEHHMVVQRSSQAYDRILNLDAFEAEFGSVRDEAG